jgi:uncharacterized repeat protein (TIGR03803 family)
MVMPLTVVTAGWCQTVTESLPFTFVNSPGGASPQTPVAFDPAGNLYGTTEYGGTNGTGVIHRIDSSGREKIVYDFPAGTESPNGVAIDSAGNIYGSINAYGFVYKLTQAGTLTKLSTSAFPSPVTLDSAGNLYWTSNYLSSCERGNCGGIYRYSKAGKVSQLYRFAQENMWPISGVTVDGAGNLYGAANSAANGATIWKLDAAGNFSEL